MLSKSRASAWKYLTGGNDGMSDEGGLISSTVTAYCFCSVKALTIAEPRNPVPPVTRTLSDSIDL